MLQEASTVLKAIDKAWQEAGKPGEFTIKVLQVEEKNFFGFVKKSAIVSILYDPRKQTVADQKKDRKSKPAAQSMPQRREHKGSNTADESNRPSPKQSRSTITEPQAHGADRSRESSRPVEERATWSDNYLADVGDWLRDMMRIMGVTVPFTMTVDRQLLRIQFENAVIESADTERLLFVSLVSLLMQFLRRKYKSKLRELRVSIFSNR